MDFIKKNLLAIIVAGAAVVALILGLVLSGATAEVLGETAKVDMADLLFGVKEETMGAKMTGGVSIFGLISLIALVAGLALTVVSIFVEDKNFDLIGAGLIALAGVLMFLLLTAGTGFKQSFGEMSSTIKFAEVYEGFKLGAGAILYAIIAIIGGGFGVLNKFVKII